METPVYKLWMAKPTFETATMPQERLDELFAQHDRFVKEQGVRNLVYGSLWSDENYVAFGAQWFPNWKAVRDFNRCLDELHWFQRLNGFTLLGVDPVDNPNSLEPVTLDPNVEWFAHIYTSRDLPDMYSVNEAEIAEGMKVLELEKTLGIRDLLTVSSRAFNEEWSGWGIALFPSMEALLQKTQAQEKAKWWKFIGAQTFLGSVESGELIKT